MIKFTEDEFQRLANAFTYKIVDIKVKEDSIDIINIRGSITTIGDNKAIFNDNVLFHIDSFKNFEESGNITKEACHNYNILKEALK